MLDLNSNEEYVLKYWQEHDILQKSRAKNKGRKPFYFLDGPPFVSGDLHPGQMWVKSMKDVILRYKRFRGYDVYDRAGYDVHGLPIEKRAEAKLGITSKKEIETKIGVENFVKTCKDYVESYIGRMDSDYMRFGMTMDFSNPYVPSRTPYMEVEWSYLKRIHEKGLLYEDRRATTFCTSCGTSVSQGSMEVEYRDDTDPSIFVAFRVNEKLSNPRIEMGSDLHLLIWTTTPWTLPSNVAVAVNPKEQYVIARLGERRCVLIKSRLDAVSALLNESAIVESAFYGSELEGIHYINPLEANIPKQKEFRKYHRVIMAEGLVSSSEGSGIVHIAPGHGLEDYLVGKKNRLPIFSPVDAQGNYTDDAGAYKGLKVPQEANKKVIDDLRSLGALVHRGDITHSYPHCWRCDTKLIFIATDQWFVNIQKVKDRIIKANRKVSWHPADAVKWQEAVLQSSPDWAISRQRYWGTPIPIWKCAACKEIKVIGSLSELRENATDITYVDSLTDIHRPHIDNVVLKCAKCSGEMRRVKDVLDVWFDSSVAYRASLTEEQFNRLFPMDFILEAIEQLRGWFSYQLKTSAIVHGKRPFKNVVMHGMMLGSDGREMHKKIGNYVPLHEMLKGGATADSFRLWCTSHTPQLDLIFSMDKINEANRVVILAYNMANLVSEYSSAIGYGKRKARKPRNLSGLYPEDAWILSRLHTTMKLVTESLDNYEIYKAANGIRSFLTMDMSRFYLKIAKRRILESGKMESRAAVDLVNYLLYNSLLLMAPFVPFTAEKLYLDNFGFGESVFLESWPRYDEKFINKDLEGQFDVALDATTAILNSREKANVRLRWPLAKATVEVYSDQALEAVQKLSAIIEGYVNVKRLAVKKGERSNVEIRPLFSKIGPEFKENAGAVAEAMKSANPNDIVDSVARSGEYTVHTAKGSFRITQEHFEAVQRLEKENAVAFRHGIAYVDKEISRELYEEAVLREFGRGVQLARKEMGLKKADRIGLRYRASPEISSMIEKNAKALGSDLGAIDISKTDSVSATLVKELEIEEEKIIIGIDRA